MRRNKKAMHSFFNKINFIIIFVTDFYEIIKPLKKIIKKDVVFKWDSIERETFENIEYAIVATLALQSIDFNKELIL